MAIAGKREYKVYLDEETTEYVKSFLDQTRFKGGFSGFIDAYIKSVSLPLKASKFAKGKKLTIPQLLKFGIKGLTQGS